MSGIVYILTNPAMPGLVKIGKTTRDDPQVQMDELYTTGVPVPFDCIKAVRVDDPAKVEHSLHRAFGPQRINAQREFFEIETDQAIEILDIVGKDVTPQVNAENASIDKQSLEAGKRLSSRRPPLNYFEMSIPEGSILHAVHSSHTVEVVGPRKVVLEGNEMSLTRATRIVRQLKYSVAPGAYWKFKGEVLDLIYDRTYGPYMKG